jgi:2-succinyl-6-hydroxy-2,4-cyclohexadiene-1-carboxylate synthase
MSLDNYQFHYSFNGFSNAPVILFLHGFMGNSQEFNEVIELISDEFFCLTVDLPGHGKTQVLDGDEYYNMENTAYALIHLLDELRISHCFLVGYSMGGRLALYLTLHFPERFSKVVLESASPGLLTRAEQLQRMKRDEQIARKLVRSDFRSFLLNWYEQPIFGSIKHHPQFLNLIESRLQNDRLELAKSLRFMGTGCQPSLWDKLRDNKTPLLLLAGEDDEKFIEINRQISNICKFSQLKITNRCGHNIHFENSLAFVENIHDFLCEDR